MIMKGYALLIKLSAIRGSKRKCAGKIKSKIGVTAVGQKALDK